MSRAGSSARFACALVLSLLVSREARALTFEEAMALARERGVAVLRAQVELADARGALVTAGAPLRDNPVLEAQGGPRYTADGEWIPQVSVGLGQRLELTDARGARLDRARAALDAAEAGVDGARRSAEAAVALAFIDALAARDALARAEATRALTDSIAAAMEARARGGDASAIDVRRLRVAVAQARAEVESRRADSLRADGTLAALLGLAPGQRDATADGTLAALVARPVGDASPPPSVLRLRASIREAAAERRVGDAMAVPELGIGALYQYEEGDHMGLLALSFTLPFFDHGQGTRASADARREALERELDQRSAAIERERAAARQAHEAHAAALRESERALTDVAELDAMARRSFEAGETSLSELLIIRAELLAAARAHTVRERDAAAARVALATALGAPL